MKKVEKVRSKLRAEGEGTGGAKQEEWVPPTTCPEAWG